MKRFLLLLSALVLTATFCEARKLPAEALGTVKYEIRYKWGAINAKVASIDLSLAPEKWENHQAYHSKAIIKTSAVFSLFIGADMTAESYIEQSDLQPLYFINPHKKGGKDVCFTFVYNRKSKKIESTFKGVKDTSEKTFPMDGKTYDLLSAITYVRFLDASKKNVDLNLLLGEERYPGVLTYEGKDTEKFPGRETDRFVLRLTGRGVMENGSGNELTFWRSTGSDRKLIGLEAPISPGFMTIRIKE
jgi:hypothetical protein